MALRQLKSLEREYILYDYVAYLLTGKIEHTKNFMEKIKDGIQNLCDLNLIKMYYENRKGIEADLQELFFSTKADEEKFKPFVIIKKDELITVMNSGEKFPFKLLRYFTTMIGTISNATDTVKNKYSTYVGCRSIQYLASNAQISESAAIDYNDKLEKMNMIVIHRSDEVIADEKGQIKSGFTNCYGRPEYSSEVLDFQMRREKDSGNLGIKNLGKKADEKRQMKQYYNQMKKGKEYGKALTRKVYNYFSKENSNYITSLNKIRKFYHDDKITLEQMEEQMEEYKQFHSMVDISFLEEQLIKTGNIEEIDDDVDEQIEDVDNEWVDEVDNVIDEIIEKRENELLKQEKKIEKIDTSNGETYKYRVENHFLQHCVKMIRNKIYTLESMDYYLKYIIRCDKDIADEYIQEIKKILSKECNDEQEEERYLPNTNLQKFWESISL